MLSASEIDTCLVLLENFALYTRHGCGWIETAGAGWIVRHLASRIAEQQHIGRLLGVLYRGSDTNVPAFESNEMYRHACVVLETNENASLSVGAIVSPYTSATQIQGVITAAFFCFHDDPVDAETRLEYYLQRGTHGATHESLVHPQYFSCGPPTLTRAQAQTYGLMVDDKPLRGVILVDTEAETCQPLHVKIPTSWPRLIHLPCPLPGSEKYLGGVSDDARYVYGVPGGATRVVRMDTQSGALDAVGPVYAGKFKWLRGVTLSTGTCLALPCHYPGILKIAPEGVSVVGQDELAKECKDQLWLYHGGCVHEDVVYAIPANAKRVFKYDSAVTFLEPSFGDMGQKWYGGITGEDGNIYGIPHNHTGVLMIDPRTDQVSILEADPRLPEGRWKWHGGLRAGHKIYGFPNNADTVLVIDTRQQRVYTVGDDTILKAGRHRDDNRYKYLGGALTADGKYVYLFPCDAEQVLRIDTRTDELKLVGPLLLDGPNKFQNGFVASDGCLYGIPQRAIGVLRIEPPTDESDEELIDVMDCCLPGVRDKFEGGVMGPDGNIYCMPLRAKMCVKVEISSGL